MKRTRRTSRTVPTRRTVPAGLMAVALVALALVGIAPASQAATTAGARCSSTDVTVLVQFPDRTVVGCTHGDPASGYDALRSAGFAITFAQGSGAGALCQINSFPDHACPTMPAADAYWAYFHARNGAWSYSSVGGGSSNPKPGTVEGWRFGGGEAPSSPPPAVATGSPTKAPAAPGSPSTAPTRTPVTKPTPKPPVRPGSPTSTAAGPAAPPTSPPSSSSSSSTTPGAPQVAPTSDPSASAAPLTGTAADDPGSPGAGTTDPAADAAAAAAETSAKPSHGLSWVWGLVLLGVVAAAGGAVALGRRRG